jgi:hypothetical protein
MMSDIDFPRLESQFPDVMDFVAVLARDYRAGLIDSWEALGKKVRAYFTPARLSEMDAVVPGWHRMALDAGGITLVHVMAVYMSLLLCPEFRRASRYRCELMKWIVFFHDIAKEIRDGRRDFTHEFHSAVLTAETLPGIGFNVTPEYSLLIKDWVTIVNGAITVQNKTGINIQDNSKLPEIFAGIERLFGHNTPAALIVKSVLFHMSFNVVKEWPQAAPLTESEIKKYVDFELLLLLKMMILVDNDAWALFDPPLKKRFRRETLKVFRKLAFIIKA